MRELILALLGVAVPRFAAQVYTHAQTTATISASAISRYVTLTVQLRNIGGIATACVVKASGQKRVTREPHDPGARLTLRTIRTVSGS